MSHGPTRVVLVANTFTSLETEVDALGEGEILIRTTLGDLEVGMVPGAETPTVLPQIDDASLAVRILKPVDSTFALWVRSPVGGNIYIERAGPPLIGDDVGVTSA